jgi:hypothetical protein
VPGPVDGALTVTFGDGRPSSGLLTFAAPAHADPLDLGLHVSAVNASVTADGAVNLTSTYVCSGRGDKTVDVTVNQGATTGTGKTTVHCPAVLPATTTARVTPANGAFQGSEPDPASGEVENFRLRIEVRVFYNLITNR